MCWFFTLFDLMMMMMIRVCMFAFGALLLYTYNYGMVLFVASPFPSNDNKKSGLRKEDHLISSPLPGLPHDYKAGFKQYSGYITVDAHHGRALFYYFVQALAPDPLLKPLTLWLSGGHGCSSVGNGAFVDHGPFRVKPKNYSQLIANPYSWNRESNMLYVESPAGTGWSYSNTTSDYNTNDVKTAKDNLAFLLNWFILFEEYKGCKFFISGVSYAGHYVPPLAALVLEHNKKAGKAVINLQGISLGDPLLLGLPNEQEHNFFLWTHGLLSDETYNGLQKYCGKNDALNGRYKLHDSCSEFQEKKKHELGDRIETSNINADVCTDGMLLMDQGGNGEMGIDVCIVNETAKYLNIPEVQKAFHANTTKLNYPWTKCSSVINYQANTKNNTMIPIMTHLLKAGVRMLVYSGDFDGVANFEGTRRSVHQLALSMNMHVTIPYSPWYLHNQLAGWTHTYNGTFLTYALARCGGHSVPNSVPEAALLLFQSFIENKPLPLIPTFTSKEPSTYASS